MNGIGGLQFRLGFEVISKQHEGDDERCTVKEDVVGMTDEGGQERQNRRKGDEA